MSEISSLMRETVNHGLLDCGAAKTVAGSMWYDIYLQSLSDTDRQRVTTMQSSSKFKFGDGETVESKYSAMIPCALGKKAILIAVEVVESDIPLLLSSETMKRLKINLNFEFDTVTIFGESHPVGITSTGHYVIPLNVRDVQVTLLSLKDMMLNQDPVKSAKKLHQNFSHGDSNKIIKLMRQAGFDQKAIEEELIKCESKCEICLKVKRAKPRPKICLPLADTFNGCISIDLKMIKPETCQSFWILHITDVFTRFSMGIVIADKSAQTVLNGIFTWIGIFGRPGRMLSDNGKEFDNQEMRELCSTCNISILMTAVEAPWSNGICEKGNDAIGKLTVKIINDVGCTPEVGVNWAVNARNTLVNVYGYSPQQLVLGRNSSIQSDEVNLPSLNQTAVSKYVSDNLNAIAVSRSEFLKKESAVRLQRAFRTRTQYSQGFTMGDLVYYRRDNRKEWLGPAKVIGAASGVVWIDHGRIVKIHPCKVRLCQEVDQDLNDRTCTQNLTDETTTQTEISTPQQEEDINIPTMQLNLPPLCYDQEEDDFEDNNMIQSEDVCELELEDFDELNHSHLRHLIQLRDDEQFLKKGDKSENISISIIEMPSPAKTADIESDEEHILLPDLASENERSSDSVESTEEESESDESQIAEIQALPDNSDTDENVLNKERLKQAMVNTHQDTVLEHASFNEEQGDTLNPRQASTPLTDEPKVSIASEVINTPEEDLDSDDDDGAMISATEVQESPESLLTIHDMIKGGKVPNEMLQALQNTIKGGLNEVKQSLNFSSKTEDNDESREKTSESDEDTSVILLQVPRKRYHERDVQDAMNKELEQFKQYEVYQEVEDTGQTRISTKWVVTEKSSSDHGRKMTKARLVCRGFEESTDEQLNSPTVEKISIRLLFCVVMANGWKCESLDVKAAFLQSEELEREVYVTPPTGISDGKIWRLRKPMYGLKDASRKWFLSLRNELKNLGCEQSRLDKCIFTYHVDGELCGIFVSHVDDFLIAGNEEFQKKIIQAIKEKFNISKHELGMFAYVGLEVNQSPQGILISQRQCLSKITPAEFNQTKKGRALSESEIKKYRSLLGKLTWLVTQTRPDHKVAVLDASLQTKQLKVEDLKNLNQILAMMNTTPGYSLSIVNLGHIEDLTLSIYCDAAYSVGGVAKEGNLIFLTNGALCNIISWTSKKVKPTLLHSYEAEIHAVVNSITEAVFINEIITETLKLRESLRIIIHCDCDSLRKKLYGSVPDSKGTRKYINWIRERVECGEVSLFEWIPGTEQIADALTKVKSPTLAKMNSAINNNIHPWAVGDRTPFI